jgi:hypothetical protein
MTSPLVGEDKIAKVLLMISPLGEGSQNQIFTINFLESFIK